MTTPLTLTPVGGVPCEVVTARMFAPDRGMWIVDAELSAASLAPPATAPTGKVALVFGGATMVGTIDPTQSGTFGPTGSVRVVGGANGWGTAAPAQDFHADNGVLSTTVYQAIGSAVGETVVDLAPSPLGVDFVYSAGTPASAVFRDLSWFVDLTGTTYVGPRPPGIADPSLVIRSFDPVQRLVEFACEAPLLPNTTLMDARFNGATVTVYNIEQIFDGSGSRGKAWAGPSPTSLVLDDLKAAALYWTRAAQLRVYRYRLVQYSGNGPGGGPSRMALQAVAPSAGVPDILPIAPWSGVAGVVSKLAPSQEVLVLFENADPTLPRVVGYSLVSSTGGDLGLPLTTTMDAQTELDVGPTCPLVKLGGGADFIVQAVPYNGLLSALSTFSSAASSATTAAQIATAAGALSTALGGLPPPATTKTKAG